MNIDTNSKIDLISYHQMQYTCASFIAAHKLFRWWFFFVFHSISFSYIFFLFLSFTWCSCTHKHNQIYFFMPNVVFIHRIDVFTRNGKNRGRQTRIKERPRKSYERNVLTNCSSKNTIKTMFTHTRKPREDIKFV